MVTKEEALAELQRRGVSLEPAPVTPEMAQQEIARREAAPPRQQDFFERTGEAFGRRGAEMTEILEREQGPFSRGLQMAGKAADIYGDVLGNLAISGYRALPEAVRGPIETGISGAVRTAGALPVVGGGTMAERLPGEIAALTGGVDEGKNGFREKYPTLSGNLSALGSLAMMFAPIRGPKEASAGLKQGGKITKEAVRKIIPDPKLMSADDIARQANKAYRDAARAGGNISDDYLDDIIQNTRKALTPATPEERIVFKNVKVDVDDVLDGMEDLKKAGQGVSLEGFDAIDKRLGELAFDNFDASKGTFNAQGRAYKQIQETIRDAIEDAPAGAVTGGDAGFEALKRGRELWNKKIKLREIENIAKKAELSAGISQPSSIIKSGLRSLAMNEKKMRGFSAAEKAALREAMDTGVVSEMLRPVASRLFGIAGMAQGPATGGAFTLGSLAAREGANIRQLRKLQDLGQIIATGSPVERLPAYLRAPQALGTGIGSGMEGAGSLLELLSAARVPQATALGLLNMEGEQ